MISLFARLRPSGSSEPPRRQAALSRVFCIEPLEDPCGPPFPGFLRRDPRAGIQGLQFPDMDRPNSQRLPGPGQKWGPFDALNDRSDCPRPRLPAESASLWSRSPSRDTDLISGFQLGQRSIAAITLQTVSGSVSMSIPPSASTGAFGLMSIVPLRIGLVWRCLNHKGRILPCQTLRSGFIRPELHQELTVSSYSLNTDWAAADLHFHTLHSCERASKTDSPAAP